MGKKNSPSRKQPMLASSLRVSVLRTVAISLHLQKIILFLLFLFLVFLRFYKSAEWFSFNFDEEYQAFLAWAQVIDFHPIWIGVNAGNTGYYLGPAITYLNAILFYLSNGDPIILAYFSPLLGLFTIISIYYVVDKVFSPKAALYSSLIYGLSPLLNFFDRRFWNPSFIPLFTVWLLFSLYMSKKNTRWFILSAIIMSSSLHVHLSLLLFWPIIIYLLIVNFKKIGWKTWTISIASYLIIASPLMVYDVVHNFDNLRTPIRMFTTQSTEMGSISIRNNSVLLWSSLSRFWHLQPFTTIQSEMGFPVGSTPTTGFLFLSLFSLFLLGALSTEIKLHKDLKLLLAMDLISILAFILFPGHTLEYYLLSFFTLFSISAGISLGYINQRVARIFVLIFAVCTTITILTCDQSNYGLMARKEKIIEISKIIRNKQYSVTLGTNEGVPYSAYGGWCYLLQIYAGKPASCPADESFGWIYKTAENNEKAEIQINMFRDLHLESVN